MENQKRATKLLRETMDKHCNDSCLHGLGCCAFGQRCDFLFNIVLTLNPKKKYGVSNDKKRM